MSGFGVRQFHIGSCLMAALAGGLLISLPALSARAQRQVRQNKRRAVTVRAQRAAAMQSQTVTPSPARPNRAVSVAGGGGRLKVQGNIDPNALQLLAKMFRPGVNYEGVEVSNASMSGSSSEEMITGDANGRARREYLSPETMRGDIILTAPNQSYQFHNRNRELFAARWPVEQGDKFARLRAMAKAGRVRIQITGEEMVAGRSASIVTVSALTGGAADEARKVMYLDKETGIQLRMDRYNSAGRQISSTYMKNIAVGTTLDATKFDPRLLPPATTFPWFPEDQPMFTSVEQARSQVPFTVREPKQLPPGYILDGVWVFAQNPRANRASVLLRYSSGVNHFSLFETLAPANATKPARPGLMRPRRVPGGWAWRETVPEGDLTLLYTGHLPDADLQTLQTSMR